MSLSLSVLQILVGLADDKTLTEIGSELYLSQSAVSKILRQTESDLGFALVEQVGRRLRLTPPAVQLAQAARGVLTPLGEVNQLADELRRGTSETLQVVSSRAPANYILPTLIQGYLQLFPNVQVDLDVVGLGQQWVDTLHEPFDIVVGPSLDTVPALRTEPLYVDEMVFVVRKDSPFATNAAVTWRELSDLRIVGEFSRPFWKTLQPKLALEGFEPHRRVEVHGSEVSKQMVEAGAGGAILRKALICRELLSGYLVRLQVEPNIVLRETVYVGRRPGTQRTRLLEHFWTFLLEHIGAVYPPGGLC
jgi:DNA-binding transcriptional LysR family regulator